MHLAPTPMSGSPDLSQAASTLARLVLWDWMVWWVMLLYTVLSSVASCQVRWFRPENNRPAV